MPKVHLGTYMYGPFRELIKNADDAGATVVKICYDSRATHPRGSC